MKKAYHFIKNYPLTRKDPAEMLKQTLIKIEDDVLKSSSITDLNPISEDVKKILNHPRPEILCQIEVEGERNRYIIFIPLKFFDKDRKDNKIVEIYDLVYLPQQKGD